MFKKRKHSEAWDLSKKAQLQKKGFQLKKEQGLHKKARGFHF
jgi:hypothetical protein